MFRTRPAPGRGLRGALRSGAVLGGVEAGMGDGRSQIVAEHEEPIIAGIELQWGSMRPVPSGRISVQG